MNLKKLCHAANIRCDDCDIEIKNIRSNSKKVEKGDLFVCVKGLNHDGHDFVKEAERRGAAAIVSEHEINSNIRTLFSENTRKALPHMYNEWYGYPTKNMKLVAVTGTNGKTSVTYLLKAVFDAAMYKTGLIGTVESYLENDKLESFEPDLLANMTTPDPEELFRLFSIMEKGGAEYVFMEASSHALALDKLEGLEFEAAVFTNLTQDHLDFHRNMENYFLAKAKLFEKAKKKIINIDDPYGVRLKKMYGDSAVGCSITKKCGDFFASDIESRGVEGSTYRLISPTKQFSIKTPLIGEFNVMNTLEAVACAVELGVTVPDIKCAVTAMNGVPGRLEKVKLGKISDFSVFIDYAHTPDALKKVLETVRHMKSCEERIVLVFGCGGDRDKGKREKMGKIAAEYADFTIVTSDNSRSEKAEDIIAEILCGIGKAEHVVVENRAKAIEYAIKTAQKGDIILLAGKGHEKYEIDNNGRRWFDEKKIVVEAAQKYSL